MAKFDTSFNFGANRKSKGTGKSKSKGKAKGGKKGGKGSAWVAYTGSK
jgi:hypothetical protein